MATTTTRDRRPVVVGVDGCRTGWVVAIGRADTTPHLTSIEVMTHIGPIVERARAGEILAVGIDMPMGLPEAGARACDVAARHRLGPRRSSVFPSPVRAALGSIDHADAVRRSRVVDGRGLSIQAFNLLPKIAELDSVIDASLVGAVIEVHPESSFAEIAGAPLLSTKRTAIGRHERRELLAGVVPGCPALVAGHYRGAAPDDVFDAVAVLWSTNRWARGEAIVLGDGAVDRRALPMRIAV